jgi:predicted phage gp36 major capsid-like protein
MSEDHLTRLVNRNLELRAFLARLIDPEDLGHAVPPEVRAEALRVLIPSATVKPDGTKQETRLER